MSFTTNDNGIDREMTDAEQKAYLVTVADAEALAVAQAEVVADKAVARQAVLDKLGLSADEAKLLLG